MTYNNKKKQQCIIIFIIILPAFLYLAWSLSALCTIKDLSLDNFEENIIFFLSHFYSVKKNNDYTIAFIIIGVIAWMVCFVTYYSKVSMNLMHGKEYGTASFGSVKEFNKKYKSKIENENKILSEHIRMKYDTSTLRNNNVFIIGGSGAGKTAFEVTPNLVNNHGSMVYTDPKGSLLEDYGNWLNKQPYTRVKQINLCEMEKSMRFNPFAFIRNRSDVPKLIRNIMLNTTPQENGGSADPFWDRAESLYLQSIFLYVWMECPRTEINSEGEEIYLQQNFKTVLYILDEAKVSDDGEKSPLDIRFEVLKKNNPKHPAVITYKRFMAAAGDTMRSIIICANSRFNDFDNPELLRILSDNDIPLDEIGIGKDGDEKTKTHLFLIIPDDHDTYNFIPGMIYTLLFQELYYQARFYPKNKLPLDVGIWLDEFANIKMPANFEKILATCRSRGVYCVPILQSLAQIKKLFKDGAWEGVVGNCDTFIYLGGNEQSSHKYVSELLGKWTIDKKTDGESKGTSGSVSKNYDVLGRDLIDSAEMRLLSNNKCIIFVRGEKPLMDDKWFPWSKKIIKEAEAEGKYSYNLEETYSSSDEYITGLNDKQLEHYLKISEKNNNIVLYDDLDPVSFMKMNIDDIFTDEISIDDIQEQLDQISEEKISEIQSEETAQMMEEELSEFLENYDRMSLLDIFKSPFFDSERKKCMKELSKLGLTEETIKDEVSLDIPIAEVQRNVVLATEYYS
jgi:type IV secretion system protein VirD4